MPDSMSTNELRAVRGIEPQPSNLVPGWAYSYLYDNPVGMGNRHMPVHREAPESESFFIYAPMDVKKPPSNLEWHDHYDPHEARANQYDPVIHPDLEYLTALSGLGHLGSHALRYLPTPILKIIAREMDNPESVRMIKGALSQSDPRLAMENLIRWQIKNSLYSQDWRSGLGEEATAFRALKEEVKILEQKIAYNGDVSVTPSTSIIDAAPVKVDEKKVEEELPPPPPSPQPEPPPPPPPPPSPPKLYEQQQTPVTPKIMSIPSGNGGKVQVAVFFYRLANGSYIVSTHSPDLRGSAIPKDAVLVSYEEYKNSMTAPPSHAASIAPGMPHEEVEKPEDKKSWIVPVGIAVAALLALTSGS